MVKALNEQAQKLWHLSNVVTNEPALKLAQRLTELTFAERVFFCNSGGEANEAAFKLARRWASTNFGPEKNRIIETGRASCRESGCQYVTISVVDGTLNKK